MSMTRDVTQDREIVAITISVWHLMHGDNVLNCRHVGMTTWKRSYINVIAIGGYERGTYVVIIRPEITTLRLL